MTINQKCHRFCAMLVVGLAPQFVISTEAKAQTDTAHVPDYFEGGEGTLNGAVAAAINDGTLSNKVFMLKPNGLYLLTGTITVPGGQRLTVVAPEPGTTQQTALPQIRWSDTASWTNYSFRCLGNVTFKNVWLLYADMTGNQRGTSVQIADSPDSANGQHGDFEGVIFDYAPLSGYGGGSVEVAARHFRGRFTNCYFRNNIDRHYRYYGRAVSFPFNSSGWHTDSLIFVNCTFANIGYVIMQEGGEYTDFLFMNHCTFLNTVMYTLESGWWYWLSLTNSVFVNAFMYGYYPALYAGTDELPPGGTVCIDSVARFGYSVPFTDQQRHILFAYSSYFIEDWLKTHMANADPIWLPDTTLPVEARTPHPMPMMNRRTLAFFDTVINGAKIWPYINRVNLYDSTDPGFVLPATNEFAIKRFLTKKWTSSEDTNWAFMPEASLDRTWPLPEMLRVSSGTLRTAGMGGFPLGDLYHWDKAQYTAWKEQESVENAQIVSWLSNSTNAAGERPGTPGKFALTQNYPNPFNPSTMIRFDVGTAGVVSLKVFDLLGREVATVVNDVMRAGSYDRVFNAHNLASGVYFYRLAADNFTQTKKLVVLK